MAEKVPKRKASSVSSLSELYPKYNSLIEEVQELEVINSELESLRKNRSVYVKSRGGNIFFLSPNSQKTAMEYKQLLKEKQKEKTELESKLQKDSKLR